MSGPIFTECARTAPNRTSDAFVFLQFSAYLLENLDIPTIAGRLLPWHGRDRKKISRKRRISVLHGSGGGRANRTPQIRAEQLFTAAFNQ